MIKQTSFRAALTAALAIAAVPAFAASDMFLQIPRSAGESSTVEVQSFSWGVSQHGAHSGHAGSGRWKAPELNSCKTDVGGRSSGAAPSGAGCVSVVTPRDAGSGQASGRKGWDGCVKGTHFASVTLTARGSSYTLGDATVDACSADGMVLAYRSVTKDRPAAAAQAPAPRATLSGSN